MSNAETLHIYQGDTLVGTLHDEQPLRFSYTESWHKHHPAISPSLDTSQAEHAGNNVEAYFENLLPEASIRELLKLRYQVSSTFGLLKAIGGDTAGNLTILPSGEHPTPPRYQPITWQDVADEFHQQQGLIRTIRAEDGMRISLAGAQRKLSLCIDTNGNPLLPLGHSPSTHIVKPDIKGIDGIWASAINETFVMQLASKVGIGVAEVQYQPLVKACIIKRYDRTIDEQGRIKRLHQLDFCQIDSKPSTVKYETDGGPGALRCREILSERGLTAADSKRFLQWLAFNLCAGNHDSHAKNLSLYYHAGVHLAPFYDLLCTSIYPGLSRTFAFRIGGKNLPANIQHEQWTSMAAAMGFKPTYVLTLAGKIAADILHHLDDVAHTLSQAITARTEQTMIERLHQHIMSNTRQFEKRLAAR